jgi:hypothetical protein
MSLQFLRRVRPFGDPRKRIRKDLRVLEAQLVDLENLLEQGERVFAATATAVAALEAAAIAEGLTPPGLAEAQAAVRRARLDLDKHMKLRDQFIATRDAFRAALQ